MVRFDVLTLFPEFFRGWQSDSIISRAVVAGLVDIHVRNLRDWSNDPKHHKVDDRPYGGGPGMVLKPEPVVEAVEELLTEGPADVVLMSPAGRPFTQRLAEEFSKRPRTIIVCGHYEGYDERIREILRPEEISIGDYVLTGGELPAMVVMDAAIRLIPGALGDPESPICESFATQQLDHPHYTRPEEYRGYKVPEVLISGDHSKIARWRQEQSRKRTAERRPDLMAGPTTKGEAKRVPSQ